VLDAELAVSAAQVLHERVPRSDRLQGPCSLEAAYRTKSGFEPAVVVAMFAPWRAVRSARDRRAGAGRPAPGRS
jgi:hypothetical protein